MTLTRTSASALMMFTFIVYQFLVFGVLVQGAKKGVNDNENAFSLILEANNNNNSSSRSRQAGYSSDGVELFQGDIIMTDDIRSELRSMGLYPFAHNIQKAKKNKRPKRAAISNKARRWMGANGRPLIPYVIEPSNYHARRVIQSAMRHWTQHVPCLKFVRRTNQPSYLSFYSGGGCFSQVGRGGGYQRISIGPRCDRLSIVVHEIGHALGFWHEQSRPDRDRYVKIYWQNILPQFRYAFHKYADGRINSLGVPYDYDSVMHYDSTAFGQGRTTITRINGDKRLGNKRGLSPSDIKQARLLYCGSGGTRPTRPPRPATRPPTGCQHKDLSSWCNYWSKQGYCSSSSSHYAYMLKNCKKTCQFCKKKPTQCQDKNKYCRAWKNNGKNFCTVYKNYMRINCKKSCGFCT